MTEMLLAVLTLFFIGATGDRGQANFHVQQKVGQEIQLFDGTVAFMKNDGKFTYYLRVNEYVRSENGTLSAKPAVEMIVRTASEKEPVVWLDAVGKTYRANAVELWLYKDFPTAMAVSFGIDHTDKNELLPIEVVKDKLACFSRLENGGFLMRVKDHQRADLLQSLTLQVDRPGQMERFKKPYIINVTFDISPTMPGDSLFAIPDGFKKVP